MGDGAPPAFGLRARAVADWATAVAAGVARRRLSAALVDPRRLAAAAGAPALLAVQEGAFEAFCAAAFASPAYKWSGGSVAAVLSPLFRAARALAAGGGAGDGGAGSVRFPAPERSFPQDEAGLIARFESVPTAAGGGGGGAASATAAVTHGISALREYINLYRSEEAAPFDWAVGPLSELLLFLREAGKEADAEIAKAADGGGGEGEDGGGGADGSFFNSTAQQERVLSAIRAHIGKFRGDARRPAGYVVLMTESIHHCAELGNAQMASVFLRTVETSNIDLGAVPRRPKVAFKFHLGRLYMQQGSFAQAEQALTYAFAACDSGNRNIKRSPSGRQIAACLTPVRLRLGSVPPPGFLAQYGLELYEGVVAAVRLGNALQFEEVLQRHMSRLVDDGTLLVVEQLRFAVYRNLVARTLAWARTRGLYGEGKSIVPLGLFTAAFRWQLSDEFGDFDDEEMACVLSNLIKLGYLKGYLAWEHEKVVLAKTNPLPPIRQLAKEKQGSAYKAVRTKLKQGELG